MGVLRHAQCECGFEADVASGVGMLGVESTPLSCSNCREIRTLQTGYVDATGKRFRTGPHDRWQIVDGCPVCGHDVTPIRGESAVCPRCGRTMRLELIGVWD